MSMYRPHWMPSVGDPGGYNGHQAQPTSLHPPAPHQASTWPTPPPSTRLASSASPPSSYASSSTNILGSGSGTNGSSSSGNQQLPPTPPKDPHNVQSQQSQDHHQLGHSHHAHSATAQLHGHHQPKHEPSSTHPFSSETQTSGCLMPSSAAGSSFEPSLSRDDGTDTRLNSDQATEQQYNHHSQQQHQHETKDNLLSTKSELNVPSSMGPPSLDIKHQPQSPISQNSTSYDHHPPPSSSANASHYNSAGDHSVPDGYGNSYSTLQTSSSSAYSPPLHHHQGQQSHLPQHNSSGSLLLGAPPLGSDSGGVRGSASSTGGSDYSVNNSSPPINHSALADPYSSSGHVGAIRNSSYNSSAKGSSKGKNRPNAGKCMRY